MNRLFRILTAIIIISAIGISLSYAETIWEKRQKAINPEAQPKVEQKAEETAESDTYNYDEEDVAYDEEDMAMPADEPTEQVALDPTDPFNITVPAAYGTIIDSNKGTNGSLIICIQDAHANYEAQKNISGIIESLIKNYNLGLVLMEGKLTNRDFKYLRYRAPSDVREEIADRLLKDGTFNGVNYLDLSSNYPILLQGVEDKNLYDMSGEALWEMDKFKDAAGEYINKLIAVADQVKLKIYNPDLLEFDKKIKDYGAESIDIVGYYTYLYKKAEEKGAGAGQFENFTALVKANDIEKKINMENVFSDKATDEEKAQYKEYTDLLKKLNTQKLFKEEPMLESALKDALAENNGQKELLNISKALDIIKNLLVVKVVPEEYDYFVKNKKLFDPESWADFLRGKSNELNLGLDIPENFYIIKDNIPVIEKFYSTAVEREKTFVRKSEDAMTKDNIKIAALIAGGFHTPTLTQLLNEKGYSYIVISPKVTTKTDDNLYRQTLKREWAPGIE